MFFTFQGCASGWTHDPVGRRLWSKKIPNQCLDRAKNRGLWISGLLQAPFHYPTSDTIVKCKMKNIYEYLNVNKMDLELVMMIIIFVDQTLL